MDDGSVANLALAMRLERLATDLDSLMRDLRSIAPELRERIFVRLGTRIHREQQRLHKLRDFNDKEQQRLYELGDLNESNQSKESISRIWSEVTSFEQSLHDLFEECLALIEGAAVRQLEGPGTFCAMADTIIDDILSNIDIEWRAFTVPATSEFFSGSSRVIRVRYPSMSVWDLPIVAHELAHFVGPALSYYGGGGDHVDHPFERLVYDIRTLHRRRHQEEQANEQPEKIDLDCTQLDASEPAQMNEIFADMFAAYVCGPAYLLTSIILRFDPVNAAQASFSYPASNDRVLAIKRVLRTIIPPTGGMAPDIYEVLRLWESELLCSGANLPDEDQHWQNELDEILDRITYSLDEYLPFARFSDFDRAMEISDFIIDCAKRDFDWYPVPGFIKDIRPICLLNGAWLARLHHPELSESLENQTKNALRNCRKSRLPESLRFTVA